MLNIAAIEASMRKLGLNGSELADACGVSKEATSNWRNGESIPRPSKLAKLAEVLQLTVEELLQIEETPAPLFAYRTKLNRPVTGDARAAAEELARHLQQLLPYVEDRSEFESPVVREPSIDDERIRNAANAVRTSLRLAPTDVLSTEDLESLFQTFGAIMVPVLWGLNKEKHENALTVYLPDSKTSWVVFNLGCKQDDYKYWLAHEYGHCLTLHGLTEEDGELFAEAFAQHLVFPQEVAHECLERMRKSEHQMQIAEEYATRFGISIVTVLKVVDRLSKQLYGSETALLSPSFWMRWNAERVKVPSMSQVIFGTDTPSQEDYVLKAEAAYKTPVFQALADFQQAEAGRNPAFIASALKIGLGDAIALSRILWQRQS
jgi:transcriptional regulator with XRE-family HTH domain